MSFSLVEIAIITLGAIVGGFVNGLTGFGTALSAMPIWVQVLPPASAGAMGAAAGVVGQLNTLHMIWRSIEWRKVAPIILAGLAGVPVGTMLLPLLEPRAFKLGVGAVLVAYTAFALLAGRIRPPRLSARAECAGDVLVGLGAGIMGGVAGLSGPLPIVWATFKPWTRDQKRALFQTFNTAVLSLAVASSSLAGLLGPRFWAALAVTVPGTLVGVRLGAAVYRRLDDRRFDRLVIAILMVMGLVLIVSNA